MPIATGVVGVALEAALKAFQTSNGLAADGVLGNGTRAAMNADTNDKARIQTLIVCKSVRLPLVQKSDCKLFVVQVMRGQV